MEVSSKTTVGILIPLLLFLYALFWVLSRRLLFNSQQRNKKLQPPVAGGAWPVIGHLHLLGGSEPAYKTLGKMADVYGPIFTLKMGSHRAVVVSDWEIAKECFTTNDKVFASRPKLVAAEHMGYDNTMFAFTQYGSLWRLIRKITTHEVLSNHRLDFFQHIRRSEVQISIKKLHDMWVKSQGKKVLVEMNKWFGELTLNTIFRVVVGKRFSTAFEGSDDGGVEGEQFREALKDFFELFGAFVPSDSFPFLSWLDLGGYEKAMKKIAKVLDKTLQKWLIEHQQRRNYNDNCDEVVYKLEEDFMDVMLSNVQDVEELSGYDVGTITKSTCLNLILGGGDTTQVTMTWALSLLLNNEDILKKAQLELDEQVGRNRLVTDSDTKNLLYIHAIVKETMRLYPAAPLAAMHEAIEDCTVARYHIPARTRLIINLKRLQRDNFVWEDPHEFRPGRFLTTHKDIDVRGQNPQLMPFGSGRRMCPGVSFAIQVMHLTLANLLHGFEIGRPSQELINMDESIGLTSIKTTPLEVVLTPRLSAHVYVCN